MINEKLLWDLKAMKKEYHFIYQEDSLNCGYNYESLMHRSIWPIVVNNQIINPLNCSFLIKHKVKVVHACLLIKDTW